MKPSATVSSSTFLSVSLCIGLGASLLLNMYQLYSQNEGWLHEGEWPYKEVEVGQLQRQLSVCHREGSHKDSVIAVLKHGASTNAYPTRSVRRSP